MGLLYSPFSSLSPSLENQIGFSSHGVCIKDLEKQIKRNRETAELNGLSGSLEKKATNEPKKMLITGLFMNYKHENFWFFNLRYIA